MRVPGRSEIRRVWAVGLALALAGAGFCAANSPAVIRTEALNASVPIFVPVHPRVATTIRFPSAIGDPMGSSFVQAEDWAKTAGKSGASAAEYLISYVQGDAYFTVRPIGHAAPANLNVPFEGQTVVLYFCPVEEPLAALASLVLVEPAPVADHDSAAGAGSSSRHARTPEIERSESPPAVTLHPATPARLDGLLAKLKLIHAAKVGGELQDVALALKLRVAVSAAEEGGGDEIPRPVNENGLYQLVLLRTARDEQLDAVGFVVLMRNTSEQTLVFDTRTFAVRAGVALYVAAMIDAPAQLKAGEAKAAYFVVAGNGEGRSGWLRADNDWRVSVQLIQPQMSPGSSILPTKPTESGGSSR